ncbi:MAG: hypothetical protein CFE35_12805 [Novosphingobium sp. PASSN1]|nr:MAG: hypothetical protein CFE35_12805 [Novosphingobium sp. PASSN1]
MTLDPYMQGFIDHMRAAGMPPDFAAIGPLAAKAAAAESGKAMGEGPAMAREQDLMVDGADGPLKARLYVPDAQSTGLLVYYHGGGWVLGNLDGYNAVLRRFAKASGCAVLSIEYRLAPEFPFPVPVDDCYAALSWAAAHRQDLGLAADAPIAVGGDSAGGNLAAVVSLLARDRGGPRIALQLLIYPVTDCDLDSSSYQEFKDQIPLSAGAMRWFWDQYVPNHEMRTDPRVSPMRAADLGGLPPVLLAIAGYDPLYSEGVAYGARLKSSGVVVRDLTWEGLTHGFFQFAEILPPSAEACDTLAAEFRTMLSGEAGEKSPQCLAAYLEPPDTEALG